MDTSVYSEIYSKKMNAKFDILVKEMKNINLLTSIPLRKGEKIAFDLDDELIISYFFGDLKYAFEVAFLSEITVNDTSFYHFKIINVDIENNFRKEPRKNVEYRAIYWTPEGINFATILDISDNGMRVQTNKAFNANKIELYYNERGTKGTKKVKGTIMWSKTIDGKFEYGLKLFQ